MAKRQQIYERIRYNVTHLRDYYGFSQEELAKRAGISKSLIAKIELGQRSGKLDKLELIATKGFGITLAGLVELDLKKVLREAIEKYKIKKSN